MKQIRTTSLALGLVLWLVAVASVRELRPFAIALFVCGVLLLVAALVLTLVLRRR